MTHQYQWSHTDHHTHRHLYRQNTKSIKSPYQHPPPPFVVSPMTPVSQTHLRDFRPPFPILNGAEPAHAALVGKEG